MPAVNLRRPGMCTMNLRRPPTSTAHLSIHLTHSARASALTGIEPHKIGSPGVAGGQPRSQPLGTLEGGHHTIIVFSVTSGGTQFDGTNFSSAFLPAKSGRRATLAFSKHNASLDMF